jgi:hypothetical protein
MPENVPASGKLRTGLVCVGIPLVTLVCSLCLWGSIPSVRNFYEQVNLKPLPSKTSAALASGPFLWIVALAGSARGWLLLRSRGRTAALTWFFWLLIVMLALIGIHYYSLFGPMTRPMPLWKN